MSARVSYCTRGEVTLMLAGLTSIRVKLGREVLPGLVEHGSRIARRGRTRSGGLLIQVSGTLVRSLLGRWLHLMRHGLSLKCGRNVVDEGSEVTVICCGERLKLLYRSWDRKMKMARTKDEMTHSTRKWAESVTSIDGRNCGQQ